MSAVFGPNFVDLDPNLTAAGPNWQNLVRSHPKLAHLRPAQLHSMCEPVTTGAPSGLNARNQCSLVRGKSGALGRRWGIAAGRPLCGGVSGALLGRAGVLPPGCCWGATRGPTAPLERWGAAAGQLRRRRIATEDPCAGPTSGDSTHDTTRVKVHARVRANDPNPPAEAQSGARG